MPTVFHRGEVVAGRYTIDDMIGEGGMQEVYLAKDVHFERYVALKTPKNDSAKKRFAETASLSAKVAHPNVAQTLDYFIDNGREILVEEYIVGANLAEVLDRSYNYFDPHLAAHVIHHFALGLKASHHAGVFHRDIKPSNLMVSSDESFSVVKITDFGIAKMAAAEIEHGVKGGASSIIASKTVVGALPYMAPELVARKKSASFAADIWSLGALLYHLVCGEPPFGSELDAVARILAVQYTIKSPVDKPQYRPLFDQLAEIIAKCLVLDPARRPSIDDISASLSTLCYCSAPRLRGKVKRYGRDVGDFGFISTEGRDAFFHIDSYYGPKPMELSRVSFCISNGTPSHRAFPVVQLK